MALSEIDIFGGKAVIFLNDYEVWQFRCWIKSEKKYVRLSLKTKDRHDAIDKAEDLYMTFHTRVKNGEKIFGAPVEEAIQHFLRHKEAQIGVGDDYTIVKGRYETIQTHLRHFVRYIGKKTKITDLDGNFLNKHINEGVESNYVAFRQQQNASDSTIRNEMSTIGACFNYLFDEGHTNIRKVRFPKTTKYTYDIDANLIRRQTFTREEYRLFTTALSKSYVAKYNNLSEAEMFDRQLARHYFLFAANSGMRSGEIRKLRYENIDVETIGGGNTEEIKVARVSVPKETSKVRKSRIFYCVGADFIERWGKEWAKSKDGLVFSRDGSTELHNSFFLKHFRRVMAISKIEKKRQKELVPYSLRHFCITQRVMSGCRFEDVALMTGTSTKQIEATYFHLNEQMMKRTALARYEVKNDIAIPIVNVLDETL